LVAEERIELAPGSMASAIAREAARLALEPSAVTAAVQQNSSTIASDWWRVRRLKPGTEIVATVRGAAPARRHVAMSDQSGIDLLNVTILAHDAARAVLANRDRRGQD